MVRVSIRSTTVPHLKAFDIESGKELWELALGTAQKAAPIFADGKIYVGTDNGTFHIIRPQADRGDMLSKGAAEQRHELLRL